MLHALLAATCLLSPANDRLIRDTFAAWSHISRDILRLPPAPPPRVVLFDRACTHSFAAHPGGEYLLLGAALGVVSAPHGDSITVPNGSRIAVSGIAFTSLDQADSEFFVAALPDVWAADPRFRDDGDDWPVFLRSVMVHELTHTRQLARIMALVEPAGKALGYRDLDDDMIQRLYSGNREFSASVLAERDLLFEAGATRNPDAKRRLIRNALDARATRIRRFFSGDSAPYAEIERRFLDMEGVAVWASLQDALEHRAVGETSAAVVARLRGKRKFWSQDYGLAAYLALADVAPAALPSVFPPAMRSVFDLLDEATRTPAAVSPTSDAAPPEAAAVQLPTRSGRRAMMPRAEEIALARSAAPASVSARARVLVFADTAFVVADSGSSGVTCVVNRSWPQSLEPHCYDAEASATILPMELRRTMLLHRGRSEAEANRDIADGLARGAFRLPRRAAMSYMMSDAQRLVGDDATPAGHWLPHVMIYQPFLTNADVGFGETPDMRVGMVSDAGTPMASLMLIMPKHVRVAGTP